MAANLEKRVDALERELRSLRSAVRKDEGPWWSVSLEPSKTILGLMKWLRPGKSIEGL
jgi:hypothetical protein